MKSLIITFGRRAGILFEYPTLLKLRIEQQFWLYLATIFSFKKKISRIKFHEPELLIMDGPIVGVDALQSKQVLIFSSNFHFRHFSFVSFLNLCYLPFFRETNFRKDRQGTVDIFVTHPYR